MITPVKATSRPNFYFNLGQSSDAPSRFYNFENTRNPVVTERYVTPATDTSPASEFSNYEYSTDPVLMNDSSMSSEPSGSATPSMYYNFENSKTPVVTREFIQKGTQGAPDQHHMHFDYSTDPVVTEQKLIPGSGESVDNPEGIVLDDPNDPEGSYTETKADGSKVRWEKTDNSMFTHFPRPVREERQQTEYVPSEGTVSPEPEEEVLTGIPDIEPPEDLYDEPGRTPLDEEELAMLDDEDRQYLAEQQELEDQIAALESERSTDGS